MYSNAVPEQTDWRLRNQDRYLRGATLERKHYRAWGKTWEHDHCDFCFAEFTEMPDARQEHQTSNVGFAVQGVSPANIDGGKGNDYFWVCSKCAYDFKDMFEWQIIEHDDPPFSRRVNS